MKGGVGARSLMVSAIVLRIMVVLAYGLDEDPSNCRSTPLSLEGLGRPVLLEGLRSC